MPIELVDALVKLLQAAGPALGLAKAVQWYFAPIQVKRLAVAKAEEMKILGAAKNDVEEDDVRAAHQRRRLALELERAEKVPELEARIVERVEVFQIIEDTSSLSTSADRQLAPTGTPPMLGRGADAPRSGTSGADERDDRTWPAVVADANTGDAEQLSRDMRVQDRVILSDASVKVVVDDTIQISERARARVEYLEARRQQNLEQIVRLGADQVKGQQAPSTPVDEEWKVDFFERAKDVSNEDMQQLWARVLVGEVKRPGSFGAGTLDVLRRLSTSDAVLFLRAAACAEPGGYIPSRDTFFQVGALTYEEFHSLIDAGLMAADSFNFRFGSGSRETFSTRVFLAGHVVQLVGPDGSRDLLLPSLRLTRAGMELARIARPTWNMKYLELFSETVAREHDLAMRISPVLDGSAEGAIDESNWIELPGDRGK